MILILKSWQGEYTEDYRENITHVFEIRKKGLTSNIIEDAYRSHMVQIFESHNLAVNPHWLNLMEAKQQPQKKLTKAMQKEWKSIMKDNPIAKFVVETYKVKELKEIHEIVY